ncbi:MAG: polyprenol monophosphomannose synthase [Chitinophagaceae bacterium]|nr:polyprenol monophosphomannose synthase [Oligoflexus sp.]
MSNFKAIVVIPTYNEALNIEGIIKAAWAAYPKLHVLVVDDNSQDGTGQLIKAMQAEAPDQLFLLSRAGKLGLGTAYIAGFEWALERGYDALVEMDADFSHDPAELPALIRGLHDADVVIGSRYVIGGSTENWNFFRKLISRAGGIYARTILGMTISDLTGGFNAWTAEALRKIGLKSIRSEGYSFQIELKYRAFKAGCHLVEHPIVFSERREGQSKMSGRIVIEALFRVWSLRFS